MALRRSPKPGALTAATLRPPRNLLTIPYPPEYLEHYLYHVRLS
jgi:hypothetical protein